MLSPRASAAGVLARVLRQRQYLDTALAQVLEPAADRRDRALTRELCYGVLRWYPRLDYILAGLLNKPLKAKDTDIRMLMLCGLYQLDFLRVPGHAAVAGTVEAARELKKPWAAALVNAVLRRYQREASALRVRADAEETARYAHPAWLLASLRRQWPQHWQAVVAGNNRRPPLHLRVNLQRGRREDYLATLHNKGIEASALPLVASGVHVHAPLDVEALPGFADGLVSVQDAGAQLAARLLEIEPGQRILDACAAPGGKTGHIAELAGGRAELVAVESDPERVQRLEQSQRRLGFNAKVVCSDIIQQKSWWDGQRFARILLDVPCSATGVIRRHPDIKVLRTPDQIARLQATQRRILESVWPTLEAGGKLLYVTCSVLREEGDEQIARFLERQRDAVAEVIPAEWGVAESHGRQLLPGLGDSDGFYYARLLKTA